MPDDMQELEKEIQKPRIQKADIPKTSYLSSGCTVLNLAASGTPYGAFIKGGYHWMCGDSDTGKTWLAYTCLAEAANDPNWDDYDLIIDDAENGGLMDHSYYFGEKMAQRVIAPRQDDNGDPLSSNTIEDFYFGLDSRLTLVERGKAKKFICVLDSIDALTSKYEKKKFEERKKAHTAGTKPKGDFGDGKAKVNSTHIRELKRRLLANDCTLIIISQTRDNIDAGLFDAKSVTAGGRALKFYAVWQLWSSPGGTITKSFRGKKRQLGIVSRCQFKKNHLTGKNWTVEIPLYHTHGIDDVECCVDYLVEEGWWKKTKKKSTDDASTDGDEEGANIDATEFKFIGKKEKLIEFIEEDDMEPVLRRLVTRVWRDTEEKIRPKRKQKYS